MMLVRSLRMMEGRYCIILVFAYILTCIGAEGPVYDGGQPQPSNPPAANGNFLTQTVYGFLDFTTTIGNTVMVFSPQSAPPPEAPKPEAPIQENIIDTKPPPSSITNVKPEAIKPSKLSAKDSSSNKQAPISSAITIVSSNDKKEEKPQNVPKSIVNKQVVSKVEIVAGPSKIVENNTPKVTNKLQNKQTDKPSKPNNEPAKNIVSSVVQVKSSEDEPAVLVTNNNIGEPEFDFLSKQPSEFVEETYKVINLRPSKAHPQKPKHKNRLHPPAPPPQNDDDEHPIGLVTTLGGTVVKDGVTIIHETSVIGTYISGKYAQVLNSNSKILNPSGHKAKISPSPTQRILKTAAPAITKHHRYNLEPTPASSLHDETVLSHESNFGKTTRRPSGNGSFKNRHRPHANNKADEEREITPTQSKKYKNRNSSQNHRSQSHRYGRSHTPQLATVSVFSEPTPSASYTNRRKNHRNSGYKSSAVSPNNNDNHSNSRRFKPRVSPSSVEQVTPTPSTSIYKFKLNRTPGRWQYKSSPKPKVNIRKMNGGDDDTTTPNTNPLLDESNQSNESPQSRSDNDLELSGSQNSPGSLLENDPDDNSIEKPSPVETIKVEISTPTDFKDVYYEIATLRTTYTVQVGRVKNTRVATITSTISKSIEPSLIISPSSINEPLTENILATASPYGKDHNLDSSIAILPPITLSSDMETPPLETVTETFSTTQNMLKTHILPIVRDGNITSSLTFIQTYQVTRFVTATKTLPPMDYFQFIPSKTLKEFNSRLDEAGSELHLELDFGDSNEDEDGVPHRAFPPDLDLANVGSDFDLTEVDKYRLPDNHLRLKKAHSQNSPKAQQVTESPTPPTPALSPEQAQQLALLRLLNPAAAAQIPNVVTTSKPILKYETIYESHAIPIFDGKSTVYSTISRPVATVTKTEYEIGTSSLPALPLQPLNPLFPQQFQVTSTPVVVNTEVVATESKVLKLTFGAKTVFTTLYNTKLVPTAITSYITQSVPVQPSAGYPGYFPAPFAPFPYVG